MLYTVQNAKVLERYWFGINRIDLVENTHFYPINNIFVA